MLYKIPLEILFEQGSIPTKMATNTARQDVRNIATRASNAVANKFPVNKPPNQPKPKTVAGKVWGAAKAFERRVRKNNQVAAKKMAKNL